MKKMLQKISILGMALLLMLCVACGGNNARVFTVESMAKDFQAVGENTTQTIEGPLGYLASVTSTERSDNHEIHLSYPKSENEYFNRSMRQLASREMKMFHAFRKDKEGKFTLTMNYQVANLDDSVLSILLLSNMSWPDGSYLHLSSRNFSVKTGYPLVLDDLFLADSGYDEALAQLVTGELMAMNGRDRLVANAGSAEEGVLSEGFSLSLADLSDFYLEGDSVCFILDRDRVAVKDEGAVVVKVEKAKLAQYLAEPGDVNGVEPTPIPTPVPTPAPHDPQKKYVALTFDDGPNPKTTPMLLDILKEKNVKATFFCLGSNVDKYPEIAKRAADEGHLVCSHTYSHKNLNKLSADEIKNEMERADQAIQAATGQRPKYIRPPYGNANDTVKQTIDRPLVNWSVDPEDWKIRNAAQITSRVVAATEEGDIILSHDIYSETVNSVAGTIDQLRAQGYEFVTVDQLFAIYETNPQPGNKVFEAK